MDKCRPKCNSQFGRISGVKKDATQQAATDDEVSFFLLHRQAYDPQTGLNRYDDERLIRAREAMILAVQIFNSAALRFKTEVFTVLANIAWTYLMHEHLLRNGVDIKNSEGFSLPLSEIVKRQDCPLSEPTRQNLRALKILRDDVEHHLLGRADVKWLGLFQACCLNFDKALCELFGDRLTLANDLNFALQFARMNMEQATLVQKYELPPHIEALDAKLTEGMSESEIANTEFQFRGVYTLSSASKSHAHIHFVKPDSAEGKTIHNILSQRIAGDEFYPHKPTRAVTLVCDKTGKKFTSNHHRKARNLFKVRPGRNSTQPENTDKRYCLYHPAHKDYTYSDEWVQKLVDEVNDSAGFEKICAVKP